MFAAAPFNRRRFGQSEAIQFDGLSAFRPYGRDLVEFFNSTGRALELSRWRDGRCRVSLV